jgi:hypothetical protein
MWLSAVHHPKQNQNTLSQYWELFGNEIIVLRWCFTLIFRIADESFKQHRAKKIFPIQPVMSNLAPS